jgi:thymidylate synthase ThyX
MNFRELLHFFRIRISGPAQWEIREVGVRMLELIYPHAPGVFGPFRDRMREERPEFFEGIEGAE